MLSWSGDDIGLFAVAAGIGACMICCIVVLLEVRACRQGWVEEAERRRNDKLNGLTDPRMFEPIELIGSRPHRERPQGVDWSISFWALKRGEYAEGDRGFV